MAKLDTYKDSPLRMQASGRFEAENKNSSPVNLLFLAVVLLAMIWIGVLISLGNEIFLRVFS